MFLQKLDRFLALRLIEFERAAGRALILQTVATALPLKLDASRIATKPENATIRFSRFAHARLSNALSSTEGNLASAVESAPPGCQRRNPHPKSMHSYSREPLRYQITKDF
jgi:hypothetical protein